MNVGLPSSPCLQLKLFRDVVAELNVRAGVQSEVGLLVPVSRPVRILGYMTMQMFELRDGGSSRRRCGG